MKTDTWRIVYRQSPRPGWYVVGRGRCYGPHPTYASALKAPVPVSEAPRKRLWNDR